MKTISVDKYYMETKRCTSCKFELPPGSFNRNKSRKDGLQSKCRECSRIHTRNYYRENIEDQRAKTLARNRATQEKLYILVNEYLTKHPCPCGESDPVVLDFHHLDQTTKEKEISTMIRNCNSWVKIQEEISKCQTLCCNCHRRETAKQLGWKDYSTPAEN